MIVEIPKRAATDSNGIDTLCESAGVRSHWRVAEGPDAWECDHSSLHLRQPNAEWCAIECERASSNTLRSLTNFLVEVTVSGSAEAAGLSFGPFKDFLTPVSANSGKRRIQVEVDGSAGTWAFRVDGRLMNRSRWDSAVRSAEDILGGTLTCKARRAASVTFEHLSVKAFSSSCRISIILTCHRFQQRLRVTLRNWCHQTIDSGAFEVLVANPESPDGVAALLGAAARAFPHVRVREVPVEAALATNKGAMIHRAVALSRAEWLWLTDADCLFSPDAIASVLPLLETPSHLYYCRRLHLSDAQTDGLLAGRIDGLAHYREIAQSNEIQHIEEHPWGYTQIIHRSAWDRIGYRRDIDHFAHSDVIFAEECRRHRIAPALIPGLSCLHLVHPFAWWGTACYL